ncbi:hypothetical protein C3B43_22305 [Mycobacterium kansasii]|nr:hypothetical protein C3B43_22305 [Mycobacterium kansasii]
MRIRASKRGLVAGVRQLVAGPGAGVTNIWAVFGISPGTSVVVWAVPWRPAAPSSEPTALGLRSPRERWWRPAAPSCAGLAIATGTMVATRCAQLRWACDRHGNDGGEPLRPAWNQPSWACDRHGAVTLTFPAA